MGTQPLYLSRQRRYILQRQRRIAPERSQQLMLGVQTHAAFCAGDRVAVIDVREQGRFGKSLPGAGRMHGDGFPVAEIASQDDPTVLQREYVLCAVSLPEKKLSGAQLARLRAGNELAENVRQHGRSPEVDSPRCQGSIA